MTKDKSNCTGTYEVWDEAAYCDPEKLLEVWGKIGMKFSIADNKRTLQKFKTLEEAQRFRDFLINKGTYKKEELRFCHSSDYYIGDFPSQHNLRSSLPATA